MQATKAAERNMDIVFFVFKISTPYKVIKKLGSSGTENHPSGKAPP
jgi:hypothetical protein